MENEDVILLKEIRDEFKAMRRAEPVWIKQVLIGVAIGLVMLTVGSVMAYVKLPIANAREIENHKKDDEAKWQQHNSSIYIQNENDRKLGEATGVDVTMAKPIQN